MFIHILFYVCLCVIVLSLRSDSDYNKEATYLLTYLLTYLHTCDKVSAAATMTAYRTCIPPELSLHNN